MPDDNTPRVIEDLKVELEALMAKYEPRIKASSQLGGCAVELRWRLHPNPTTFYLRFGELIG